MAECKHEWDPIRAVCLKCLKTALQIVVEFLAAKTCVCGVAKVGGKHSDWCPLYER